MKIQKLKKNNYNKQTGNIFYFLKVSLRFEVYNFNNFLLKNNEAYYERRFTIN